MLDQFPVPQRHTPSSEEVRRILCETAPRSGSLTLPGRLGCGSGLGFAGSLEASFERFHQIDHRRTARPLNRRDLFALLLLLDQLFNVLAVGVVKFIRLERSGE